jgi:aldehyde dehydrogenase (NAD+)
VHAHRQEEIVCVLLSVASHAGAAEAVASANDTRYGPSGTVWTLDEAPGLKIGRQVRTGNYGINHFNMDIAVPVGGFKEPGHRAPVGTEVLEGFFDLRPFISSGAPDDVESTWHKVYIQ